MKTKTEAAKILLNAGWTYEEVESLFSAENKKERDPFTYELPYELPHHFPASPFQTLPSRITSGSNIGGTS